MKHKRIYFSANYFKESLRLLKKLNCYAFEVANNNHFKIPVFNIVKIMKQTNGMFTDQQ